MNNREEPYSKLQNATVDVSAAPTHFPTYAAPVEIVEMEKRMMDAKRRARHLAIVEMIACCLVLILGIASTALTVSYETWMAYTCNRSGSSISAPILGIIAAALGLAVLKRQGNIDNKCLLIAHFVMSIIAAVGSGFLVIVTSLCVVDVSRMLQYPDRDNCAYCLPTSMLRAHVSVEVLILLGALVHLISCIFSSAIFCRYWCCCGRNSVVGTTVYIPYQSSKNNTGGMQAIAVPSGTKVVLLSGNYVQTGQSIITARANEV